jgi:hypothetical protein
VRDIDMHTLDKDVKDDPMAIVSGDILCYVPE